MSKILGLDIGSNSVGWALIDEATEDILGMGVRIFPDAVESKNTEQEQSKNVQRRLKRQLRRQYDRCRMRTDAVRGVLMKAGLLPSDRDGFLGVLEKDPYELRGRALTAKLELYEIGRIVDHINSRRGFQSNRKASTEEENDGTIYSGTKDGTKAGINATDEALNPQLRRFKDYEKNRDDLLKKLPRQDEGFRTIGEYLASLDPHEQRRRNRFTLRDHYRIEMDLMLSIQAKHYPDVLTGDLVAQIIKKVFHQRPLKSVRHLVGNCRFEPGKKRSHKSHPEYQEFRWRQQVNALRIRTADRIDDDETKLTDDEMATLLLNIEQADVAKKKKLELDKPESLKKAVGWKKKDVAAKANLEAIELPTTIRKLYNALGRSYIDGLTQEELHGLWNILQFAEDAEWTAQWAMKKLGVDAEKAKAFAAIKLEDGYGSVSLKAVRKILPFLRDGDLYNEAVVLAGYEFKDPSLGVEVRDKVPALAPDDARNPIVQRSFSETRKVVNAIVKKWGNPDIIRVEMARELKLPAFKRAKITKENKKNQGRNEADRQRLKDEFRLDAAKRPDVLKLRLWEDQNYMCMYTGKPISKNMLFDGSVDVDHILPYSRTLDDGIENKVVCLREVNQKKGDLTPYEAGLRGILDYEEFKIRVASLYSNHKISQGKQRKLLMTPDVFATRFSDDENNGFLSRQLNDTRFASRLAVKYLRHVAEKVEPTNGALTAMLRHHWGLDGILPELSSIGRAWVAPITEPGRKDRDDHRHHAIDALTVALTSRSLVQKLSTLNAWSENPKKELRDGRVRVPDAPIAGLRKLAYDTVDNIIVSHRKTRPGRGALHAETLYGMARDRNGQQKFKERGVGLYVVRKPLSSSLSAAEIKSIVDPTIRELVLERLRQHGVDTDVEKFSIPENVFLTPLYIVQKNGRKVPIKRVRLYKASSGMVLLRKDGVFVEPSGNDHIRIVRSPELKKPLWEVRTLLQLATSAPSKLNVSPDSTEMKLRIGDLVDVPDAGIHKVQKMSGSGSGEVALYHHADASGNVKHLLRPMPTTLKGNKLIVDVLGYSR